jgi:hypothetical protein
MCVSGMRMKEIKLIARVFAKEREETEAEECRQRQIVEVTTLT